MLSNLIPYISRHYMDSALNHDYDDEVKIIRTITRLQSGEVQEFVSSLTSSLDRLFYMLELDFEGYNGIKNRAIEVLKMPFEEYVREFS